MPRNQRDDPVTFSDFTVGDPTVARDVFTLVQTEANGSGQYLTISAANAPSGVTTSSPSKWLKLTVEGDDDYYIPMWT